MGLFRHSGGLFGILFVGTDVRAAPVLVEADAESGARLLFRDSGAIRAELFRQRRAPVFPGADVVDGGLFLWTVSLFYSPIIYFSVMGLMDCKV